ncbi:hypothetical protein GPB2148_2574 [marine gamma proteobacterium HTCC2148]|nr:hypothetical protein GPB2148_2574 [marine gamma proteobacterium HTCC2148]
MIYRQSRSVLPQLNSDLSKLRTLPEIFINYITQGVIFIGFYFFLC